MYNRQNMEKRQRLIRKLTAGTCSVIGAFFGTLQPAFCNWSCCNRGSSDGQKTRQQVGGTQGRETSRIWCYSNWGQLKDEKEAVSFNEGKTREATDKVEEKLPKQLPQKQRRLNQQKLNQREEKPAEAATGETRKRLAKLRTAEVKKKEWDSVSCVKGTVEVVEEGGALQQINFNWSKQQWGKRSLFEKEVYSWWKEQALPSSKQNSLPAETVLGFM